MKSIELRFHHLMCMPLFVGHGYDDAFSESMARIKRVLSKNPEVCLVSRCDDICKNCPNNSGGNCVSNGEANGKVKSQDESVSRLIGIKEGWRGDYFSALKTALGVLNKENFDALCGECKWKYLCGYDKWKASVIKTIDN